MPIADESDDHLTYWLQRLLTDVRLAQAHHHTLATLNYSARGGEWFFDYGDFTELVLDAHAGAVLLGVSRLLDRDPRTASLHWLAAVVSERRDRFRLTANEVSRRVAALEAEAQDVRQVRNRLLAHRERTEPDRVAQLLGVQAEFLPKAGRWLVEVDTLIEHVTLADQVRDWRTVMIAVEPWAEDVLEALRRDQLHQDLRWRAR